MDLIGEHETEHDLLHQLQAEYRITVRVLALVAEQLLTATGGERVELSFEALMHTPDLHAWRDPQRACIVLSTAR